ncbi:MAG: response regulator, partial [Armatimonadota bacterium]|nr:response regulator [Armatimonadota bacterium]
MAISILIADANAASREELSKVLRRDRDIDVVGDARDSREAIEIARSLNPSIVVLDNSVIDPNSTGVVEGILYASPAAAVIVLMDSADHNLVRNLMRAGARDCLVKPVAPDDLIGTVRSVHEALLKQRAPLSAANGQAGIQSKVIAVYSPQG